MIVKPVLPIIAGLVAVLLPVFANLVAVLLPILSRLVPVARGLLAGAVFAGNTIVEGVSALFWRPVAGAVAQARQRARAVANAVCQAGTR